MISPPYLAVVVRLTNMPEIARLVLDSACGLADWVAVQLTSADQAVSEIVRQHPRVNCISVVSMPNAPDAKRRDRMKDCESLTAMARLANRVQPRWLLLVDQDELFPARTREILAQADAAGMWSVLFRPITCIGAPDRIVRDVRQPHFSPHYKAFRWTADLCWHPIGGHRPQNPAQSRLCTESPYPFRHLAVMLPESVERKRADSTKSHWVRWADSRDWPTVPYDPDKTWDDWVGGIA